MSTPRERAESESLRIPETIREQVDARDTYHCRVCGRFLGSTRALHHIRYGGDREGMGGRRTHDPDNLVTVCWLYGIRTGIPPCHDLVHSNKHFYLPLLQQVISRPGLTVFQLQRWRAADATTQRRSDPGDPRDP